MRRPCQIATFVVASLAAVPSAQAEAFKLRAGAEVGMPLVVVGFTPDVVGLRHLFEFPVVEFTPGFGGSLAIDDNVYAIDIILPMFYEVDCPDEYCDRFGLYQVGFRGSYRALPGGITWTGAFWAGSTVLIVPGVRYEFTENWFTPYVFGLLPLALGDKSFGMALHAGGGMRFDLRVN